MRSGGGSEGLAPVTPLFGTPAPEESPWHPTWTSDASARRDGRGDGTEGGAAGDSAAAGSDAREAAERVLLKRLRTRQLSVSEARGVVREQGVDDVDGMLGDFVARGYLDDARLAEQLVHAAVARKGQGRQVISQTLAKRGIARDVADAALAALPDDDLERALDFARGKTSSLRHVDAQAALRRLTGQLSRRGYPSSVALQAAKQALAEA